MDLWLPNNLGGFAVLVTLVCLTPGPAVLFVLAQAGLGGRGAGLAAALGINAGNLVYYALSAFGLLGLLAASATAFAVLKWAGAAYLAWLGVNAIRASFRQRAAIPEPPASLDAFRDGLAVQLANPKAVLYFLALLPQFIDPAANVIGQTAVLSLLGCTVEMIVLGGYVLIAHSVRGALLKRGVREWVERASGVAFLGLAGATAFWRRAG